MHRAGTPDMHSGVIAQRLPVRSSRPVLATGAWFRNTLCATAQGEAWLTSCVGDLRDVAACTAHEALAQALLAALPEAPCAIAHDLHPDFHSTRCAQKLASQLGVPLFAVQHHHAHIAAVCAEHDYAGPVLGLALDGVGLGTDGTAWGGELLRVDGGRWQRLGHLRCLALPGGDKAAQEPWRM
ncbi:MAG: carbamoyltransferase HypF, partial [Azonexus sp.]|nr:carbamoyltransferase HypF [Azonexus sp.]